MYSILDKPILILTFLLLSTIYLIYVVYKLVTINKNTNKKENEEDLNLDTETKDVLDYPKYIEGINHLFEKELKDNLYPLETYVNLKGSNSNKGYKTVRLEELHILYDLQLKGLNKDDFISNIFKPNIIQLYLIESDLDNEEEEYLIKHLQSIGIESLADKKELLDFFTDFILTFNGLKERELKPLDDLIKTYVETLFGEDSAYLVSTQSNSKKNDLSNMYNILIKLEDSSKEG